MALTKQYIDNISLKIVDGEGYDPEEVDLLLEHIAVEVDALNRTLLEAANRIEEAEARARAAEYQASHSAHLAQSSQTSQQASASERQIAQALIAAQKSADDIRDAAKIESENAYREAERRARDIVRDALSEKQRIIDEVDRLRESTEAFRSEYMSVLSRFTSEAQKVMPKLEDVKSNVDTVKKTTAEAIQDIRDNNATFIAPEPEYVAPEPPPPAQKVILEVPAQPVKATVSAVRERVVQPVFEFDDDFDIDIEEID